VKHARAMLADGVPGWCCCWRCCYRDARPSSALFTSPSCNARSDFPEHVLCQSRSTSVRIFL